jgi:hypothetical protein
MYEYLVITQDGERTWLWGYSLNDACKRRGLTRDDIAAIESQEYIND